MFFLYLPSICILFCRLVLHENVKCDNLFLNVTKFKDSGNKEEHFLYLKDHAPKFSFSQQTYYEPNEIIFVK